MNWVNKAASVCIWEIQTWRKGGRVWVLDLETYQGSAGSEAPFIPMYGCVAHVFPLVSISVHLLCGAWWNLWYCWLNVHWRTLTLTFSSLIFCLCLILSFTVSVFLISSTEVRSEERGILERAGVVQSLTMGVAPIVVVIASVCTFTLHMAMGYDLTAAEVF